MDFIGDFLPSIFVNGIDLAVFDLSNEIIERRNRFPMMKILTCLGGQWGGDTLHSTVYTAKQHCGVYNGATNKHTCLDKDVFI